METNENLRKTNESLGEIKEDLQPRAKRNFPSTPACPGPPGQVQDLGEHLEDIQEQLQDHF